MRALLQMLLVLVVLTAGAMAVGAVYLMERLEIAPDPEAEPRVFVVPEGVSQRRLGEMLSEEGLIESAWLYRLLLYLEPHGPSPKAGRHPVSASMTPKELRAQLARPPLPEDEPFTVVEGWRLVDTDAALTRAGLIDAGAYVAAASRPSDFRAPFELEGETLEGYLLAETYSFPRDRFDVQSFLQRQIDTLVARFHQPFRDEIEASGHSIQTLVTIASMLEREEPNPDNRPLVAGVMHTRLDRGMPLGIDATSRYTLDQWNDRKAFLKKLRDPDDPYNTRLRTGLPPTGIGAPSLDALMAALRPKPSDYLYYLHDDQKRIHFARTAKEHEANRRKYNVW